MAAPPPNLAITGVDDLRQLTRCHFSHHHAPGNSEMALKASRQDAYLSLA